MNRRGEPSGRGWKKPRRRAEPQELAGGVIAQVAADAGRPGCVMVRVRGLKPWRIDEDAAAELGIARGVMVDASLAAKLEQAAKDCKAQQKLRSRLTVRPLSRMEAAALMRKAGAQAEYTQGVIKRFQELGWIDDAKLAESVATREASRPVGRMRVVARVARRGINSGEARRAAEAAVAERKESPLELAMIAARGQLRKLAPGLAPDVRQRRVLGFLARRGFDEHTAREACREVLRDVRGER